MFFRQKKLIRNPHKKWDFWQKKYDKKKEFFVQLYSGIIFFNFNSPIFWSEKVALCCNTADPIRFFKNVAKG